MAVVAVQCPECGSEEVVKYGRQPNGEQRYRCNNRDCARRIFLLQYHNAGLGAGGQTANRGHGAQWQRHPRHRPRAGSEPDDGADHAQKKAPALHQVNPALVTAGEGATPAVVIRKVKEAELDEMWSFVGSKQHPRWRWGALDHQTGRIVAYVFGRREDQAL